MYQILTDFLSTNIDMFHNSNIMHVKLPYIQQFDANKMETKKEYNACNTSAHCEEIFQYNIPV